MQRMVLRARCWANSCMDQISLQISVLGIHFKIEPSELPLYTSTSGKSFVVSSCGAVFLAICLRMSNCFCESRLDLGVGMLNLDLGVVFVELLLPGVSFSAASTVAQFVVSHFATTATPCSVSLEPVTCPDLLSVDRSCFNSALLGPCAEVLLLGVTVLLF